MPARDPSFRRKAGQVGAAVRWGDPADAERQRADLAADRIAAYVTRVVAEAPPLSEAQADRIRALLRREPSQAAG